MTIQLKILKNGVQTHGATSAQFENMEAFEIVGIQKGAGWDIAINAVGDNSQVAFTITSTGQIQYVSADYPGFVSGKIKFRAITTSM